MIHPLVGYGIKGIIWYQGESNIFNVLRYAPSVAAMVSKWREAWGLGEIPFYYAQIAPYDYKEWNFLHLNGRKFRLINGKRKDSV